jgi:hypothetical protein
MSKGWISIWVCLSLFFLIHLPVYSQGIIDMTDEDWLEMSLDMLRKGIQQEDTIKILKVCAPEVAVAGGGERTSIFVGQTFQGIFDRSESRQILIPRPPSNRGDAPLAESNLWDFEILNPHIEVAGDSAFVDCELALWGAAAYPGSKQAGQKAAERFVFVSRKSVKPPPDPEEGGVFDTTGVRTGRNRSWQLVGWERLVEFLEMKESMSAPASPGKGKAGPR